MNPYFDYDPNETTAETLALKMPFNFILGVGSFFGGIILFVITGWDWLIWAGFFISFICYLLFCAGFVAIFFVRYGAPAPPLNCFNG